MPKSSESEGKVGTNQFCTSSPPSSFPVACIRLLSLFPIVVFQTWGGGGEEKLAGKEWRGIGAPRMKGATRVVIGLMNNQPTDKVKAK